MRPPTPAFKTLVLVGGGHSHVSVLKSLGMDPLPGVRTILITRDVLTPYSGMLPGWVAGHYERDEIHVDLRPLCRFAGARLYHDAAVGLDLEGRKVLCRSRPPVAFDVLSLNVGARPRTDGIPGAAEHGLPVKPLDRFLAAWLELLDELRSGKRPSLRVAVVGAGAGGIELTLAARHRVRRELPPPVADRVSFRLFDAADGILSGHAPGVRRRFRRILERRGIPVHAGRRVARVEADRVVLEDGEAHPAERTLLVTDAAPPAWVPGTGLATDEAGFVALEPTLRSTSHPFVFAAGDVATVLEHPRPRAGVFAVRQGPRLARNLRRALQGRALRSFEPRKRFLSLIGTGDRRAVASWGPLALEGRWLWWLKERIDRRWMERWKDLPVMEREEGKGGAPEPAPGVADAETLRRLREHPVRCGGCGAKVGATVLERTLRRIETGRRADVLVGLDDPDDAAVLRVPPDHVVVQTVDFFRALVDDPWTLGRIAAHHALADLWAMGAEPRAALALATLPLAGEAQTEEELFQLLSGAVEVLGAHGAVLAGGHTGEGPELAFGLQVTGTAPPDRLLRKGGVEPGQALILTGPVGTGVLFAGEMRGEGRASWIEGALERMTRSQGEASRILREVGGATACTDVSGFGLAGHLLEMLQASRAGASLALSRVPLLEGAPDLVRAGIASSLLPENLRVRRAVDAPDELRSEPGFALLFDPQTAGPLLAAVPDDRSRRCLDSLRAAGYPSAARVGTVVEAVAGEPPLRVTP